MENVLDKEFKDLLNKENILNLLENEFFKVDDTDKEYAETISIVLQMTVKSKYYYYLSLYLIMYIKN